MSQQVDVAGVGTVSFPDGMSEDEIKAALDRLYRKPPGALKSFAGGLVRGAGPTAAFVGGYPAGAEIGAAIGGTVGSVVPVVGTAAGAGVGSVLGGLTTGTIASLLARKGQEALAEAVLPEGNIFSPEEAAAEQQAHPVATPAGELASGLGSLRAAPLRALWAPPRKAILAAGVGAALGAGQQLIQGGPKAITLPGIAESAAFPLLYGEPRFGGRLSLASTAAKVLPQAGQEAAKSLAEGAVQPTAPEGQKGPYATQERIEQEGVPGERPGDDARRASAEAGAGGGVPAAAEVPEETVVAQARRPRHVLTPQEQQYLWDAQEELPEDTPVELAGDIPEGNPFAEDVAQADKKNGRILINTRNFSRWLAKVPEPNRAAAVRSLLSEEGIHLQVSDEDAREYWSRLSLPERMISTRRYEGAGVWRQRMDDTLSGHEALRFRIQQLNRMTPREVIEATGREKWTVKGLTALESVIRGVRQTLGTKASQAQLSTLDRVMANIGIAKGAAGTAAPAARLKHRVEIEGPDGKKYPANFDGFQDFSFIGQGMLAQFTAEKEIPGVAPAHGTTYGPSLTAKGYRVPELLTQAAYQPAPGHVETGPNHPAILDRLGVPGFETAESRNTPQFGFQTTTRPFVTREQAGPIAQASGQDLKTFEPGEPVHSDEVSKAPGGDVPISEGAPAARFKDARQRAADNLTARLAGMMALRNSIMRQGEPVPGTMDALARNIDLARAQLTSLEEPPPGAGTERAFPAARLKREPGQEEMFLPPPPGGAAIERPSAEEMGARPTAVTPLALAHDAYAFLQTHTDAMEAEVAADPAATPRRPSFSKFTKEMRAKYGPVQPGQLTEIWEQALGQRLQNASGNAIKVLADSLGIKTPERVADPPSRTGQAQAAREGQIARPGPAIQLPGLRTEFQERRQALEEGRMAQLAGQRTRARLARAVFEKLVRQAVPTFDAAREVTPDQLRYESGGENRPGAVIQFRPGDDRAPNLGALLTSDARRFGEKVSTTKRLTALLDKTTGKVSLVSTFLDPRRGAVLNDPRTTINRHAPLAEVLQSQRPLYSFLLDEPVENFKQTYASLPEFMDKFGQEALERAGQAQGQAAPPAEGEQPVPGSREMAGPLTAPEAGSILDYVLDEVGTLEGPDDVKLALEGLRAKPNWQVISGLRKLAYAIAAKHPDFSDTEVIETLAQNLYENHRSAQTFEDFQRRTLAQGRAGGHEDVIPPGPSPGAAPGPAARLKFRDLDEAAQDVGFAIQGTKEAVATGIARRPIAWLISATRDKADNDAHNGSRAIANAVRLQSRTNKLPNGNPEILAAVKAVIAVGGIDDNGQFVPAARSALPGLRQFSEQGLAQARKWQNDPDWHVRRIGNAYAWSQQDRLAEVAYATAHWNDPELIATAQAVRKALNDIWQREISEGFDMNKEANYLPNRWDASLWNGKQIFFGRTKIKGTRYREARTFSNVYEAGAAGPYIPATADAAALVEHRVYQALSRIYQEQWRAGLYAIPAPDGRPAAIEPKMVMRGTRMQWDLPPTGYSTVQTGAGVIHVHDDFAPLVRALTARSAIQDMSFTRNALYLTQILKHSLLAGDFFHLGRVLYYGASIMGRQMGFRSGLSALDYRPEDLDLAVKRGAIRPADAAWASGNVDWDGEPMSRQELLHQFTGANIGKIQDALYKELLTTLSPTSGTVRRAINWGLDPTLGRYQRFLFDHLTRGVMAESLVRSYETLHARHPEVPSQKLADDIGRDVNNFFGNIGRQGALNSRTAQDTARLFMLAPQWVEGLIRKEASFMGRATGISRGLDQLGVGLRSGLPMMGLTGEAIGKGLLWMMALTQGLNLITKHGFTWENPEKEHRFDAWIPGWGGNAEGFWLSPLAIWNEVAHDLYRFGMSKPTLADAVQQLAANKESPIFRALAIAWSGRTGFGEMTTTTGGRIKEAVKAALPMPLTFGPLARAAGHVAAPGLVAPNAPGQLQRRAFGVFGVKIEPQATPYAEVAGLARDWMAKEGIQRETGWQQVETTDPNYTKLRRALRSGDDAGASALFRALTARRGERQVIRAMSRWAKAGFVDRRHEAAFRNSLTPEQEKLYERARDAKLDLLDRFHEWLQKQP